MRKLSIKKIGINDLWLTVFFGILIINIILSLVFPLAPDDEKVHLDVVMRTATAVLAGYFISKNFIDKNPSVVTDEDERARHFFQTTVVAIIGLFSLCVMILIRYAPALSYVSAVISQTRDLYLGSVAFLMGTAEK